MEINYGFNRLLGYILVSPLFIAITLAVVIMLSKKFGGKVALSSLLLLGLVILTGAFYATDLYLCYIGGGCIQICLWLYWYHEIYRKL